MTTGSGETRRQAMQVLEDVLTGRLGRVGELRKVWPSSGGDALTKRALQEAEHYLLTRGELERRFVELMQSFLETGGTPHELDRAYDEVIRTFREERG